jgi:hypothetical protein
LPDSNLNFLALPTNQYFASEFDREKVPSTALREERSLAISIVGGNKAEYYSIFSQ